MSKLTETEWARDDEYFIENMRIRREELGWSQADFARKLREAGLANMHQTTVSRMEKGERLPRLGEARGIAQVLGAPVSSLLLPPKDLQRWRELRMRVDLVIQASTALVQAAEMLDLERQLLKKAIDQTMPAESDTEEEWVTAIRHQAEKVMELLTIETAIEERFVEPAERTVEKIYDSYEGADNGK